MAHPILLLGDTDAAPGCALQPDLFTAGLRPTDAPRALAYVLDLRQAVSRRDVRERLETAAVDTTAVCSQHPSVRHVMVVAFVPTALESCFARVASATATRSPARFQRAVARDIAQVAREA